MMSKATKKLHRESGQHLLYCTALRTDGRQPGAVGSGGGLPGLVLQGEPLHPLLKLRPEVADQALGGGEHCIN